MTGPAVPHYVVKKFTRPMRKISESTVRRLSGYLRVLEELAAQGQATVSSDELAARGQATPAQVRKDLSSFGSFGQRGLGYSVTDLVARLRDILGLEHSYRLAVIGAGKIGRAMVGYRGFADRGFNIAAIYDNDQGKIGLRLNDLVVRHVDELESDCAAHPVDIAIIATPAGVAQTVLDRIVAAGVKAVLNFAPTKLSCPATVELKDVNMALELETLSYALRNR